MSGTVLCAAATRVLCDSQYWPRLGSCVRAMQCPHMVLPGAGKEDRSFDVEVKHQAVCGTEIAYAATYVLDGVRVWWYQLGRVQQLLRETSERK
eukprot:2283405-Rhodomonas_salina.4